jgi:hypothetical protein
MRPDLAVRLNVDPRSKTKWFVVVTLTALVRMLKFLHSRYPDEQSRKEAMLDSY